MNSSPHSGLDQTSAFDEPSLYLDLLKTVLTRTNFPNSYSLIGGKRGIRQSVVGILQTVLGRFRLALVRQADPGKRSSGKDWPADAETMIGRRRLDNIEFCVRDVLRREIPGDLIETGVWRGGASIFIRAILKYFQVEDRSVWVADSFQGLPKPASTHERGAADTFWKFPQLAVSEEVVKANFQRYGLLDKQVKFLPGWFSDTLALAPIERLAILRLDGDMYESTMTALECLYEKVSPGGFVIVDDYQKIEACREAVNDYRSQHGIGDSIQTIDDDGVFWLKSG